MLRYKKKALDKNRLIERRILRLKVTILEIDQEDRVDMVRESRTNYGTKASNRFKAPNAPRIHSTPYCTSPKQTELEHEEITKMQEAVAKPALEKWVSPVVFVPKKDGSLRFCMNLCRLSAVTVRHSYNIPLWKSALTC